MDVSIIQESFHKHFAGTPYIFRSPGRVNLIGEHTDYNEGFVLPGAIDKEIVMSIGKNGTTTCRIYAHDLNDGCEFDINALKSDTNHTWANYIKGVIEQFQKRGCELEGFDCVFGGDIPHGAGLSSSAALECCTAFALNTLHDFSLERLELVKLSQKAENEFVGVQCGIMDQFASMFGKKNHVMKLDCRSLDYEYFPLDLTDYRIVLCDTQVKHSLASSEFNTRGQECRSGVDILKHYGQNINSLRDVELSLLEEHKSEFDDKIYRRCKYAIEENNRLLNACEDLQSHDFKSFGHRMFETHHGLSKDYEVSCPELDFLVEQAHKNESILGSRMMGGGFGGCTINIVPSEAIDVFQENITIAYQNTFDKKPQIYITTLSEGTSQLS